MRRSLLLLAICLATFCAAFGARMAFVPDIVAPGFAEEPQSIFALETAFVLRSIENVSAAGAVLVFAIILGTWVWPKFGRPDQTGK